MPGLRTKDRASDEGSAAMKKWDVFVDGQWCDQVQARTQSEAMLEALRSLDAEDETGITVRLA